MPHRGYWAAAVAGLIAAFPACGWGQITVDGTLSAAHALSGPNYAITADLGRQVGANLFHSFGLFNLATGETATFSGPNSVSNIIARVTGGAPSSINGTITSTIPASNLFLINPAGLMFGPSAQINVPGAFHATTADYLRFTDNAMFSASTPSGSSFTSEPPQAFGFLSSNPGAALSVTGSTLAVASGAQLSLVGSGGGVALSGASLSAPSGVIHIASVAGAGEIGVDPADAASRTATSFGPVSVTNGTSIDASGTPAGAVYLRGGVLTVDASLITSNHDGAGTGGGISLVGTTSITLSSGTDVEVDNNGSGNPGTISLQGGSIDMIGAIDTTGLSTTVLSQTFGAGPGAAVTVSGTDMTMTDGAQIISSTSSVTGGRSGDITVAASGSLFIDGTAAAGFGINTGIGSEVQPGADGNAGNVMVNVGTALTVIEGAAISSETGETGNAGSVTVTAGSITTDDALAPIFGGIFSLVDSPGAFVFLPASDTASGAGGDVNLTAGQITVTGTAIVGTLTFGTGNAGNLTVNASGAILVDGGGALTGFLSANLGGLTAGIGSISVQGNAITLTDNGEISTITFSPGGGDILVRGSQVTVTGAGSQISSNTFADGPAGTVTVQTTGLTLADGGQVASSAGAGSTGDAGAVSVTASTIAIATNGSINSSTFGDGNAGAVNVSAGSLSIAGGGLAGRTGIGSDAEPGSTGNAGAVTVTAGSIALASNGTITSTTFATGGGGQISVTAGTITADGSAAAAGLATGIASDSDVGASGDGGSVTVNAGSITLQNGAILASASKGSGNGGDVTVTASGDILIQGSNPSGAAAITAAAVGTGGAGTITISADALTLRNGGLVSTRSVAGGGGDLTITANRLVFLDDSKITTSVSGGLGNGGNITIDPPFIILESSSIVAEAFGGNGGNISITAAQLITTPDSIISASSQLGISGTILIATPGTDVTASIAELSGKVAQLPQLTAAACAAAAAAERNSSLTTGSAGGLPPSGAGLQAANYFLDHSAAKAERGSAGVELASAEQTQRCW